MISAQEISVRLSPRGETSSSRSKDAQCLLTACLGPMAETDILTLADRLWRGEASITQHHPVGLTGRLQPIDDRVAFLPAFANVSAFTTGDGLVLVDTGSEFTAAHGEECTK